MDKVNEMIQNAELLYRIAYQKTEDSNDADDLVQETFLAVLNVLNKGKNIENLRAYLIKTLDSKYYDMLRTKNKIYSINNSEIKSLSLEYEEIESEALESESKQNKDEITIRKELAHLSKLYRDIMVQFYMEDKSVNEIASNLGISKDVVLVRLHRGREKMKKGIIKMDSYTSNSYKPSTLSIVISGRTGVNNDLYNILPNEIEQNLLILAYEKPISIEELSKKIGIPTAYIEHIIEKLIKYDIIRCSKERIWTNFLIVDDELINSKKEAQKQYVNKHFHEEISVLNELINALKLNGMLSKYNDTQLYIYCILSIFRYIKDYFVEKLNLLKAADYPDKPNGGKWIIHFGRKINEEAMSPSLNRSADFQVACSSGDVPIARNVTTYYLDSEFLANTSEKLFIEIWDTCTGTSPWRINNQIFPETIGYILYHIEKKIDIEPSLLAIIPDLIELGFLTRDNNNLTLATPIISEKDFRLVNKLFKDYAKKYLDLFSERLLDFVNENIISCPKLINPVSPYVHLMSLYEMAHTFIYKAAEEGLFEFDKNKNYPICLIVEK